jgi:hypothetical protein
VELVVRPEALALDASASDHAVAGEIVERRYAGADTFWLVRLASGRELEILADRDAARPGDAVRIAPAPGAPAPRAFPGERS